MTLLLGDHPSTGGNPPRRNYQSTLRHDRCCRRTTATRGRAATGRVESAVGGRNGATIGFERCVSYHMLPFYRNHTLFLTLYNNLLTYRYSSMMHICYTLPSNLRPHPGHYCLLLSHRCGTRQGTPTRLRRNDSHGRSRESPSFET